MKKKLSTLALGLTTLAASQLAFAEPPTSLHDLSPFHTAKLDVALRTINVGKQTPGIFYEIANTYTNSIVCAVEIPVPVTRQGAEGIFEVSQTDVVIFPESAFENTISYEVDASRIPTDRTIQLGVSSHVKAGANCSGWPLGRRLPRRTCLTLNPTHDQICVNVRASGQNYYPVVQGRDAHLGDCGC